MADVPRRQNHLILVVKGDTPEKVVRLAEHHFTPRNFLIRCDRQILPNIIVGCFDLASLPITKNELEQTSVVLRDAHYVLLVINLAFLWELVLDRFLQNCRR